MILPVTHQYSQIITCK